MDTCINQEFRVDTPPPFAFGTFLLLGVPRLERSKEVFAQAAACTDEKMA